LDILRIYQDYGIDHLTEGHRHCRDGWVNTECPFCTGNPGLHLSWNIEDEFYLCWRCGHHPPVKTLSALLSLPTREVLTLIKNYGVVRSYVKKLPVGKKEFMLPSGIVALTPQHKQYLKDRNFNPDKLEKLWGLKSTGPLSYLQDDGIERDYRFRIFIPINWNSEFISYDTRDATDKAEAKYKACPVIREIRERKKILYGNQEEWGDIGICVEGPTDVWRLGVSAFAVSGISYTDSQVNEMSIAFKKIAVVFDDEPQAIKQGRKLVKDLQFRNVDAYQIKIKGDPGSMSKSKAKNLIRNILNKNYDKR